MKSINIEEAFGDRLSTAVRQKRSAVCVGLDPRWKSLPESIRDGVDDRDLAAVAGATQCFCQEVIDAVADFVPIVKPQAAFFELLGPDGMIALAGVIQHARKRGLLVLLDAKRGDIGSTAEAYASAYLGKESPWKADAITVNPYLGDDTLLPFVDACTSRFAGVFVLVKTSNPGSGFLQDIKHADGTIYQRVANTIAEHADATLSKPGGYGSVGAVVGATYPEQLAELRRRMGSAWLLIPGFGAQGGTAQDVAHGFDEHGMGAIVNSSRGIIFAFAEPRFRTSDWQEAVANAARQMRSELPQPKH